ncbi:MAG: methionine--tRNA ligase [Candidatus Bathyarchaeota archaeon]|nr:MAG: methionine--tRNA ligase [Candidatus Bathyarchaeota archaeon]
MVQRCSKLKENIEKGRKFPKDRPVLVTCGLPYVNGPCHIAHLRTYVPADIFVRFLRKLGQDVVFICGSDTHGTPITVKAEEEGVTPQEIMEKYHDHFVRFFPKIGIHFANYGSTDHPLNHKRTIQIVEALHENGYVYAKTLKLPYCPNCDRFLPDRYQRGICPHCGAPARGDECDQGCGRYLEPGELIDPRCNICGSKPEMRENRHYFLRLTAFDGFLREYLPVMDGTDIARNYALKWVESGLKDWNITRNLDWGVKVPGEPDLVYYVWVDAPIGYIASTEEWAERTGGDWEYYWKGPGHLIHFIGGDIVYHHGLFWPSMLKGADYDVPHAVVASGMVKVEGKIFSKSRGYVIWVEEDYLDKGLDPDALRYYVASYTGHTRDLDFSWSTYGEKVNKELVGTLGNFLYRTLLFAHRNYKAIPEGVVEPEVKAEVEKAIQAIRQGLDDYEFKKISDAILALATYGNRYLQSREPWKLGKTEPEKARQAIHNSLWLTKALSVLIEPILPSKAESIWEQLGETRKDTPLTEALEPLKVGTPLKKPSPLFQQIPDETIAALSEMVAERIEKARG